MNLREAAQQALEALERSRHWSPLYRGSMGVINAIDDLRAALAEPVQEPVALDWLHKWANQDDGEPETQWHEGYEAARRVVQIHLTAPPSPQRPAEPVQEPVAWRFEARHIDSAWAAAVTLKHPGPEGVYMRNVMPLYTAPPQRKPLTEVELDQRYYVSTGQMLRERDKRLAFLFARAIERAHGIGDSDE